MKYYIICLTIALLGCETKDTSQVVLPATQMMTLNELNVNLEVDNLCHFEKIEKIPHTKQYLITYRRN